MSRRLSAIGMTAQGWAMTATPPWFQIASTVAAALRKNGMGSSIQRARMCPWRLVTSLPTITSDRMIGASSGFASEVRAAGLVVIGDGDDVDAASVGGVEDGQGVVHAVRFLGVDLQVGASDALLGLSHDGTSARWSRGCGSSQGVSRQGAQGDSTTRQRWACCSMIGS